jgi:hypothetical protein
LILPYQYTASGSPFHGFMLGQIRILEGKPGDLSSPGFGMIG